MIVTTVTVYVKEDHLDDFISSTVKNHENSVNEPGNLRFDLLQCRDDLSRFLIYEAYESEAAARAHKDTAHYLEWKDAVADWMAKSREGVLHDVIRPQLREQW